MPARAYLSVCGAYEITQKSDDFLKRDTQTVEFRAQVSAGKEKVITYKARYAW